MTKLLDLLVYHIERFNPANPLQLLDFIIALSIVIAFLVFIRRYPVYRVFVGIIILTLITALAFAFGFVFIGTVVGFGTFLVLISMPLIFAPEIRHYLEKLGRMSFLKVPNLSDNQIKQSFIKNLIDSIFELAERKIGATVVLQRRTGLGQTIETGAVIDARFGSKLLANLFFPSSPLHDGAVVIKDTRIVAAGCLLPLSPQVKLDSPFGTRHKAGLSITKDTDAVVILISEQRGEVSLAENGKLDINLDRLQLAEKLNKLL